MERVIDLGDLIIPLIKPQKGVDYYTASEKQELVNIVTNNVNEVVLPQEEIRQSNEVIRQDNEATRQSQEDTRQSNETSRQTAETVRASAESTRQSNETSRVSAEETRAQTFSSQMDAVDTAIAGINTSQTAFNENATSKTSDFNTNATNKTTAFNENATSKTNAFDEHTEEIQTKLATIETGAEVNVIDSVKVNGTALTPTDKEVDVPVPTKTSDLTNDSGFGTYTKPSGGIPKTDLSSDIQASLNVESKTDYIFDSSTTNYQPVINKIIDTSGAEQASTNYGYYEISVNPGEIYVIYVSYSSSAFGTDKVRYMFKNNTNVVSYTTGKTTPERTNNYYAEVINIPTGVDKLLINCGDVGKTYSKNYINKITKYHQNNIARNYLDSKLQSFFTDIYTEVQPEVYIENAYMNDSNNILSYSTAKLYALAVTPNTKYKITAKQLYINPLIFITNNNSNYTRTFNNTDYSFEACSIKIKNSTSGYQYADYEFTVPEYCEKIYINKMNNDSSFSIKKQTDYKLSACNPLKNKILCFTGDSIMAASPQGVKGWVGIMKENNPEASCYNYAHDGYTIAKAEDEWSTRSIQNTLETMLNEHSNADYIVIQGGANDYWGSEHGITLGEISSGFNTNDFDRTTFSGGLEYIFNYCYSNFPGAKVGFVVTHQVYASNFYQFMDRAKEICKKWAVPYIDLFTEGNLNFQISYMRENYSRIDSSHPSGDGLHPNLAGYEIETPKIENWLKYKL